MTPTDLSNIAGMPPVGGAPAAASASKTTPKKTATKKAAPKRSSSRRAAAAELEQRKTNAGQIKATTERRDTWGIRVTPSISNGYRVLAALATAEAEGRKLRESDIVQAVLWKYAPASAADAVALVKEFEAAANEGEDS